MPAIGTGDIGYWVLEKVMAGNRWHAKEDERGFIRTFYKVVGQVKKTHKDKDSQSQQKVGS